MATQAFAADESARICLRDGQCSDFSNLIQEQAILYAQWALQKGFQKQEQKVIVITQYTALCSVSLV